MSGLKVLVACEFSGTVREAFAKRGHDAWSCDLEPTDVPGNHYQGSVFDILDGGGWDLMIAHPPCTYLTVTGNKWMKDEYKNRFPTRQQDRKDAIEFFMRLANANIPMIAIENPIGIMSTTWRKPNQIIHPWQFGHEASKSTCLWLKNLPKLNPTNVVGKGEFIEYKSGKRMTKWYADAAKYSPKERAKIRNTTFQGIADAMADQWGKNELS
jgi:site-specific DNA-cytosine methylase